MEYLKVRTRGNASPQGKPRVYFTCHPDDFARSFDKICEDIFRTHDCAIYYTEDMASPIPEEIRTVGLEWMNLFVIPVTFRLLHTPNRAMDEDFSFAQEKHIPVLPIMMESGLDALYSRSDRFGELQYLDPYGCDASAIRYEEKLKRYLESVLISDKMVKRIQAAFDAYIFLSYRKKDRKYANELMRIIHSNPLCRDIAIWYDEFLTPGENFSEAIRDVLEKSGLFTLLVTPNLVNEPNYVQSIEYPEARKRNKSVLPAEMVPTDAEELRRQFSGIPDSVDVHDGAAFQARLLDAVGRLARRENDSDPAHNFLIGLAYLDGIDVEVDRERALELITGAAEAELPEAMKRLRDMYGNGITVPLDYRQALKWSRRVAEYYTREYGEEHPDTLKSLHSLAYTYLNLGDHKHALELDEKVYALRCKVSGEEHPDTLTSLSNLASAYGEMGDHKRALKLNEKVYALRCKVLGDEHPDALGSLGNLAYTYGEMGDHKRALELSEKVYALRCKVLGEEHPNTLLSLSNLAATYGEMGDHKRALELHEKVYVLQCKVLGDEHPDTLGSLSNLAYLYGAMGDRKRALELFGKVYALQCKVLGEEHPDTLTSLHNLACAYGEMGDHKRALELKEKVYALRCKVLGEEHPDTLRSLSNLAYIYGKTGDHKRALEFFEKVYALRRKVLGEEHPATLTSLSNLACTYGEMGDYKRALELFEKAYELRRKVLGEEHPDTVKTGDRLKIFRGKYEEEQRASREGAKA